MAFEYPILDITLPASGDLSGSQFRMVTLTTAGQVAVMGSTNTGLLDFAVGVLQDKSTAAGIGCRVRVAGVTKVIAGGTSGLEAAIVPGHYLVSTGGAVIPSSSGAGNHIVGIALEACSTFSASTSAISVVSMLISRIGVST